MFVVRLRNADGNLMPGVRVKDNGHKAGLNGVDNGQIWCASFAGLYTNHLLHLAESDLRCYIASLAACVS